MGSELKTCQAGVTFWTRDGSSICVQFSTHTSLNSTLERCQAFAGQKAENNLCYQAGLESRTSPQHLNVSVSVKTKVMAEELAASFIPTVWGAVKADRETMGHENRIGNMDICTPYMNHVWFYTRFKECQRPRAAFLLGCIHSNTEHFPRCCCLPRSISTASSRPGWSYFCIQHITYLLTTVQRGERWKSGR